MATQKELENEIKRYQHEILEIQKQIFNYLKSGKTERDYCHLMSREQFLGSQIAFNKERLEKMASSL
jgi:hypothetical protein